MCVCVCVCVVCMCLDNTIGPKLKQSSGWNTPSPTPTPSWCGHLAVTTFSQTRRMDKPTVIWLLQVAYLGKQLLGWSGACTRSRIGQGEISDCLRGRPGNISPCRDILCRMELAKTSYRYLTWSLARGCPRRENLNLKADAGIQNM